MTNYYIDSSVLISLLLNDMHAEKALEIWERATLKISSRLLAIEAWVVSHRYALRLPEHFRQSWLIESRTWLKKSLSGFYLYEINSSVQEIIEGEVSLGKCRSLDAIHLATCKILQSEAGDLQLVTFDEKMRSAAEEVGISCLVL